MANPTNREILFIVKLRNDARRALQAMAGDLAGASAASDKTGRSTSNLAKNLDAIRAKAISVSNAFAKINATAGSTNAGLTKTSSAVKDVAAQADFAKAKVTTLGSAFDSVRKQSAGLTDQLEAQAKAAQDAVAKGEMQGPALGRKGGITIDEPVNRGYYTPFPGQKSKPVNGGLAVGEDAAGLVGVATVAKDAKAAVEELETTSVGAFSRIAGAATQGFNAAWSTIYVGAAKANDAVTNFLKAGGASDASAAAKAVEKVGEEAAQAASKVRASSGAFREMSVLIREAARGDFSRMAGSASILAQQLGLVEAAGALVVTSFTLIAAGAAAFVAAIALGAEESVKFQNQLALQGNYAGLTAASYEDMAAKIAAATSTTVGSNKDIIAGLASANTFTSGQLSTLTGDIDEFARAAGQSADTVVQQFDKMKDGPAAFAAEFSKQYSGVLSPIQAMIIADIETREGREKALAVTLSDIHKGITDNVVENTGYIIAAWRDAQSIVSSIWNWMKGLGAQAQVSAVDAAQATLDKLKAAKAQAQVDPSHADTINGQPIGGADYDKMIAQAQRNLDLAKQKAQADAASSTSNKQAADLLTEMHAKYAGVVDDAHGLQSATEGYKNDIKRIQDALKAPGLTDAAKTLLQNQLNAMVDGETGALKRLQSKFTPNTVKQNKSDDAAAKKAAREAEAERKKELEHNQTLTKFWGDLETKSDTAGMTGVDKDVLTNAQKLADILNKIQGTTTNTADSVLKTADGDRIRLDVLKQHTDALTKNLSLQNDQAESDIAWRTQSLGLTQRQAAVEDAMRKARDQADKEGIDKNDPKYAAQVQRAGEDAGKNWDLTAGKASVEDLAKTYSGYSTKLMDNLALQKQLQDIEALRAASGSKYNDLLQSLGISQDKFNAALEAANDHLAENNDWMSAGKSAAEEYVRNIQDSGMTMKKVWSDAFSGMTDAIVNFVTTGKLSFKSLVNSIIADIVRMEAEKASSSILGSIFGFASSAINPLSLASPALNILGSTSAIPDFGPVTGLGVAPIGHSGGTAGAATGSGRGISEAVFRAARRYHVGGTAGSTAGLRSGEVPVIAKKGEALLPTARMSDGNFGVKAIIPPDMKGGGGGNMFHFNPVVQVSIGDAGNHDPQDLGQTVSGQTVKALEQMVRRVMTTEMRDGGLLSASRPRT